MKKQKLYIPILILIGVIICIVIIISLVGGRIIGPGVGPGVDCGKSSAHGGSPSPSTPTTPPKLPKGTKGNQIATTTYFSGTESMGSGACGGCGAKSGYGNKYNFACMTTELLNAIPGEIWLGTAPSESMASPFLTPTGSNCGLGTNAAVVADPKTASAPCGSSFRLTLPNGVKVNLVVVDACPHLGNEKWCPEKPGDHNDLESYNHFDLWVGNSEKEIAKKLGLDNIHNITSETKADKTFEVIDTPQEIRNILQSYCCNAYWTGKGCPNICGDNFRMND